MFRAEAGAAGVTRGMIRGTPIRMVELMVVKPEDGYDELEKMLCAETMLQQFELHYRVLAPNGSIWALQRPRRTTLRFGHRSGGYLEVSSVYYRGLSGAPDENAFQGRAVQQSTAAYSER